MKVKECKLEPVVACECADPVSEVCKKFRDSKDNHVVVLENNCPVGVVGAHDIVCDVLGKEKNPSEVKAEDVMISPVFVVTEEAEIPVVVAAIIKKGLNCCPVVNDKDECTGVISLKELLTHINQNES